MVRLLKVEEWRQQQQQQRWWWGCFLLKQWNREGEEGWRDDTD